MAVEYLGHTDIVGNQITRTIFTGGEEMDALRQSSQHGKIGPSSTGINPNPNQQGQGLVALLVMIAVLCFIMTYCCWGAPCCRSFCRKHCCCQMNIHEDIENSPSTIDYNLEQGTSTPTIILLPYGRMLVVDGAVFAQFQADTTGLDLIELGESVVRAQHRQLTLNSLSDSVTRYSSTPSILEIDSETNSKHDGLSPVLGAHPPPTYESLFGGRQSTDLPPSYSEIIRQLHQLVDSAEEVCPTEASTEEGSDAEGADIRESTV